MTRSKLILIPTLCLLYLLLVTQTSKRGLTISGLVGERNQLRAEIQELKGVAADLRAINRLREETSLIPTKTVDFVIP